ncbi:MAG: 16S rRNA (adenine(1518)-N(6)/adenine(1519)-N(6))-dimethyltransferase RsmA [Desulfobaccales bacterium]|nr:16S rRNA (adenine(1518)-N(6)/adenine(1519)-N(6))-dimethyltransferase RsmA [Desulfobaccales bacterium]
MSFISPKILLRRLGLKPKKAWGQHFLLHPHQAQRIVAALSLRLEDLVVEIGAGLGALTVFLAREAQKVVALERDQALAQFLKEELLAAAGGVQVLCQDVLEFEFLKLSQEAGRTLKVVGNLPYQITSPLMFKLIRERAAVAQAVLMVQQEVGDRLLASPGTKDYGILSVLMQYHFLVTRLFSLTPANFYPAPQVASVVLNLTPQQTIPAARDENLLHQVVKAGFATRRKTLNNTLVAQAATFGLTPEEMRHILLSLDINPQRRGETLSVAEFVAVSNRIVTAAVGGGPGS